MIYCSNNSAVRLCEGKEESMSGGKTTSNNAIVPFLCGSIMTAMVGCYAHLYGQEYLTIIKNAMLHYIGRDVGSSGETSSDEVVREVKEGGDSTLSAPVRVVDIDDGKGGTVIIESGSSSSEGEGGQDDAGQLVRLVVQRCRSASLLVSCEDKSDPEATTTRHSKGCAGIIAYISFASTNHSMQEKRSIVLSAARTLLNLPVVTLGKWGDGSKAKSVLKMASELDSSVDITNAANANEGKGVFIMIVPQANLICKVKNLGKSVQYHQQINKDEGRKLYEDFTRALKLLSLEQQLTSRGMAVPERVRKSIKAYTQVQREQMLPSCPPDQMFKNKSLFASWDDSGFPLTNADGVDLAETESKSAMKKLRKLFDTQKKRYSKYLQSGERKAKSSGGEGTSTVLKVDDTFVSIIPGTFGNLQALDLSSDMGPFCHIINL